MIVDTVSQTGNRMVWEHQRVYDALLRITSRREMIGTNEGIRRAYGECGDISNLNGNFWRTIFGDSLIARDGQSHRLSSGDIDTISSWWNWFVLLSKDSPNRSEWASIKPSPEYQQVFEMFTERTRARRFFITENDRMGMGVSIINAVDAGDLRSEVRVGDVICLLYGSNLPVVLRRLDQQSLQQSVSFQHNTELVQIYSYIGTCCVHGIMDGEALAKPRSGNENGISSLHIGGFKRAGPEVETDRQSKIFEELPGPLQLLITRAYGYGTETKQQRAGT
jgi:hypothetical protein